jgi:hypothetical protein
VRKGRSGASLWERVRDSCPVKSMPGRSGSPGPGSQVPAPRKTRSGRAGSARSDGGSAGRSDGARPDQQPKCGRRYKESPFCRILIADSHTDGRSGVLPVPVDNQSIVGLGFVDAAVLYTEPDGGGERGGWCPRSAAGRSRAYGPCGSVACSLVGPRVRSRRATNLVLGISAQSCR